MDMQREETSWEIPAEVWNSIACFLPLPQKKKKKGRPRMDDYQAMSAILYKLRTGCSWKELPKELGAGSTVYDRYQEWQKSGVFEKLDAAGIKIFDHEVIA